MDSDRAAFLAGDRVEDVLLYFAADAVSDADALAARGERVDGGVVLVIDGERGRSAFGRAVGVDPMAFARRGMDTEGEVAPDCTGGRCPAADEADGDHAVRFIFAFAEAKNEEAGGLYAEGDVIHAYAQCACGEAYSDKWLAGQR
ncbi:hypothetical protein BRC83_02015 [Halobacteriales archaeon QS_1_68_17]|nr:MAG: hypothetical protein BRC83_02015 [Halobacteriales archaeon QS_1_68_17]